jgi:hypothetical protein
MLKTVHGPETDESQNRLCLGHTLDEGHPIHETGLFPRGFRIADTPSYGYARGLPVRHAIASQFTIRVIGVCMEFPS